MKYLRHFPNLWRTKTSCLRKQTTQFLFYIRHNYSLTCLLVFQLDHRSHSKHAYLPVTYTLHCACALHVHMSRSTKTKYMRMNKPKEKLSTPSKISIMCWWTWFRYINSDCTGLHAYPCIARLSPTCSWKSTVGVRQHSPQWTAR